MEITGDIRRELRGYLDDWHGLIRGNGAESRRVFDLVLRDRIRFRPVERKDGPGYELTVPIAFDRLVVSVIPSLQVRVAPQCQPVGTRIAAIGDFGWDCTVTGSHHRQKLRGYWSAWTVDQRDRAVLSAAAVVAMHGVGRDNAPRRSRIPSEYSGSVHSVPTCSDRQHRLRRTAAIRRARHVRNRQRPEQRDRQQRQGPVPR